MHRSLLLWFYVLFESVIANSQHHPFVIVSNHLSQSNSLLFKTQLLRHSRNIELADNIDKFEYYIHRELRNYTGMCVGIFASNIEELVDVYYSYSNLKRQSTQQEGQHTLGSMRTIFLYRSPLYSGKPTLFNISSLNSSNYLLYLPFMFY